MELLTAMSLASAAFNFIKKGIETGKEIEGMSKQLGSWFEAVNAFKVHESAAKHPPLFKKLLFKGSVEQEAMQIVMHRRLIEKQEAELRELITLRYGIETYREMINMRRQIAQSRATLVLKRKQAFKELRINTLLGLALLAALGALTALIRAIISNL